MLLGLFAKLFQIIWPPILSRLFILQSEKAWVLNWDWEGHCLHFEEEIVVEMFCPIQEGTEGLLMAGGAWILGLREEADFSLSYYLICLESS